MLNQTPQLGEFCSPIKEQPQHQSHEL
jgi:hypothetical protein